MMMWPWPDGDPFGTGRGFPATENPDVRLTYEVAQRLQADPRTRGRRITVEVQSGVVLLEGSVGSPQVKQTAADTARGTPGVRDVCNTLRANDDDKGSPAPPEPGPASGPPRWWSDHEISQQFDRLVAGLPAEPTTAGPVSGGARRRMWVAIAAAMATAWALLSVVIVMLGWLGVVIGCLCAAATSAVINTVRGRRRRRATPAGHDDRSDHGGGGHVDSA